MMLSDDHVTLTCLSVVSESESAFLRGCILFIFILTDCQSEGGSEGGREGLVVGNTEGSIYSLSLFHHLTFS